MPEVVPDGLGCSGLANEYGLHLPRIASESGAAGFQFTFARREWAVIGKFQSLQCAAEGILNEPGECGVGRPIGGITELVDQ